jgi:hypothetical protein
VAELVARTGRNPFGPGEPLAFIGTSFPNNITDPTAVPDMQDFFDSRLALLNVFEGVMEQYDIDAFVYPQMWKETPDLFGGQNIGATTVSEINLLGTPGVTVPAGYYSDGSPFSVIFLGEQWSEAELLGYAFDYEQATLLRDAPVLVPEPGTMALIACAAPLLLRRRRRVA